MERKRQKVRGNLQENSGVTGSAIALSAEDKERFIVLAIDAYCYSFRKHVRPVVSKLVDNLGVDHDFMRLSFTSDIKVEVIRRMVEERHILNSLDKTFVQNRALLPMRGVN